MMILSLFFLFSMLLIKLKLLSCSRTFNESQSLSCAVTRDCRNCTQNFCNSPPLFPLERNKKQKTKMKVYTHTHTHTHILFFSTRSTDYLVSTWYHNEVRSISFVFSYNIKCWSMKKNASHSRPGRTR